MPPLKTAIFDVIEASGERGVSSREVLALVYVGRRVPRGLGTVHAHVMQINDLLVKSEVEIRCVDRRWRLTRVFAG